MGWRTILAVVATFSVGVIPCAQEQARPNVLFIAVDDLGCSLGCYGHPVVKSPQIDRLAQRGVRFERAYCQFTVCNPSRTSLLTGLRPDRTHVFGNGVFFRTQLPNVVTLPERFRQSGYYAASLGKIFHRGQPLDAGKDSWSDPRSWDTAQEFAPTARGKQGEGRDLTGGKLKWCHWLAAAGDDEDQPDGQITREAIRLLTAKRAQPLFLAVGFHKPHDPFIAPKKYFDLYPLASLRLPKDPSDRTPDVPLALPKGANKEAFDRFTDQDRREFMRSYYAGISFTDAQVGKLLDALDRLGLADNTIIVFWGDHGYHVGERGWWNKVTLFELCARVPFIVATPGAKGNGQDCAGIVELLDIFPMLTDLCRVTPPAGLEGRSFRPLLADPTQPGKSAAVTQIQRGKVMGSSLRTDRYRYTEWGDDRAALELYDHRNDPAEYHNLAGQAETQPIIDRLRAQLRALRGKEK